MGSVHERHCNMATQMSRRAGLNLLPNDIGLLPAEGRYLDQGWRQAMASCDESAQITYSLRTC